MNRNEHNKRHNNNAGNQDGSKKSPVDDAEVEINDLATEGEPVSENTEADEEISELETLKNLLASKEEELEKEKKEYLFLMAEFDNFRKRTIRERGELIKEYCPLSMTLNAALTPSKIHLTQKLSRKVCDLFITNL